MQQTRQAEHSREKKRCTEWLRLTRKKDGAFRVVSADYVGSDEGVGIVHTAPAFGEDDYWTCKNNGIPLVNPVDAKGRFTPEITDFYPLQEEKTMTSFWSFMLGMPYIRSPPMRSSLSNTVTLCPL